MNRTLLWTSIVCYGGAATLAITAVSVFGAAGAGASSGWALLVGGLGLAAAGAKAQSALKQSSDILARRESQIELLEAQLEQHRRAVDALADGLDVAIFICDTRSSIIYANRRAVELFRFDRPAGRSLLAVTLSYDLEQLVLDAARTREPQHAELNFTYPEERVALAKAWPQDEQAERVFLSVFEITDLRRLERVRQDFVSNVSHELRTPLQVIRAMAETLLDDEEHEPEKLQRYLSKVISEVDRLSMIANDLLILSAAESNPTRKHACDVADVFRGVLQQLKMKAEEKGLSIEYRGPASALIEANAAQMTQVAINLIDNAINYTQEGSVVVEVEAIDRQVVIDVRDTGIGITSDHLPRIFERFYRVDRARSRATGGTGLGLSIVKHIVEAHGGTVLVESSLNVGSLFRVTMPVGDITTKPDASDVTSST